MLSPTGSAACSTACTHRPCELCLPAFLLQLDGRVVGHVRTSLAAAMVAHLRAIKAANLAAEEQLTPGGQGARSESNSGRA
jgi:hypothetical protein